MSFVVTDKCIRCKYTDCVAVCPVNCFYEGKNMLVINPDECIDCSACALECPAEAIVPDTNPASIALAELNRRFSQIWPRISARKSPPADAEEWDGVPNKYPDLFSEESGGN